MEDYDNIIRQWYEELKLPFINYIRSNFRIDYDDILDLYTESWLAIRRMILSDSVRDENWKALIFKIGWRMAYKTYARRSRYISIDEQIDPAEEYFNKTLFDAEKKAQEAEWQSVYEDPELQAVLAAELSYIPDPCNKILKFYYCDEMSMKEIAEVMNYKGPRSAITIKNRCMDKIKNRVKDAVRRLGILE